MWKKVLDGLMFGAGFGVSFLAIWMVFGFLTPMIFSSAFRGVEGPSSESAPRIVAGGSAVRPETESESLDFSEMGPDEIIKHSSVIALAKFEHAPDGMLRARISEILKQDPGVEIKYKPGDEYPSANRYPRAGTDYGEGVVLFFTGSPATMRMSMSYDGDSIGGLGDIPMQLFRKKCSPGT